MTDVHPDVAPYNQEEADECAHEGCSRKAHTHIVVVHDGVDHRVPFCVDHHLEYSQPGHLKILKKLAGIAHLFHHDDEPEQNPAVAADQHVEPPYTPVHAEVGKDLTPMEASDAGMAPEPQEIPPSGPVNRTPSAGAPPEETSPAPAPAEEAPDEEVVEPASSQVEGQPVEPGDEVVEAPPSKDA